MQKWTYMPRMMGALLRADTQSLVGSDPHPSISDVHVTAEPGGENSQQNPVHGECSNHEQPCSYSSVPVEVRLDSACSGPVEDQREVSSWSFHAALVLGECSNQGSSRCHPGVPVEARSGPTQSGPVEDQMGSPRGTSQPNLVHGECSNHGSSRCTPGVPVEARSGTTQSGTVEDQMGSPRGTSQPKAPSQLGETDHCNSVHQIATQPCLREYSQVAFSQTTNPAKKKKNASCNIQNRKSILTHRQLSDLSYIYQKPPPNPIPNMQTPSNRPQPHSGDVAYASYLPKPIEPSHNQRRVWQARGELG